MKSERQIRNFISGFGLEIESIRSSTHWVVKCIHNGKLLTIVISRSPSDGRSIKNLSQDIKRMMRG